MEKVKEMPSLTNHVEKAFIKIFNCLLLSKFPLFIISVNGHITYSQFLPRIKYLWFEFNALLVLYFTGKKCDFIMYTDKV